MPTATKKRSRVKTVKLDIACGQDKQKGFVGIDISPGSDADIYHDLTEFPWPFEDDSVDEAYCSHYVEHTPMGNPDGLISFMEEVYRILKPGAKIRIVHPHCRSDRAFQDPTHRRFIPESTWQYFAKDWREHPENNLSHYPITTDFGISNMFYTGFQGDWGQRSTETQQFAIQYYWNVLADICVDLEKR